MRLSNTAFLGIGPTATLVHNWPPREPDKPPAAGPPFDCGFVCLYCVLTSRGGYPSREPDQPTRFSDSIRFTLAFILCLLSTSLRWWRASGRIRYSKGAHEKTNHRRRVEDTMCWWDWTASCTISLGWLFFFSLFSTDFWKLKQILACMRHGLRSPSLCGLCAAYLDMMRDWRTCRFLTDGGGMNKYTFSYSSSIRLPYRIQNQMLGILRFYTSFCDLQRGPLWTNLPIKTLYACFYHLVKYFSMIGTPWNNEDKINFTLALWWVHFRIIRLRKVTKHLVSF